MPRSAWSSRVSYCSCHVAILSAAWKFVRAHSFFTRFSKAILEALRYSKWIMQYIVGKPQMSTFQWSKVCENRSSDGKFMAPGSWVVWAVFSRFSGEDSGQKGEATGEQRVARCSWSFHLSNAPGLVDQIVVSREDSARKGGCPGEKRVRSLVRFSLLFVCVRAHIWPSSQTRFSTFLVPSEILRYPFP